MESQYLKPEAFKPEWREKFTEIEIMFSLIILPNRKEPKGLADICLQQNLFEFFTVPLGRSLIRTIDIKNGGNGAETKDAVIGNLWALNQRLNNLVKITELMEMVLPEDALLMDILSAQNELWEEARKLAKMITTQLEGYDKYHSHRAWTDLWKKGALETIESLNLLFQRNLPIERQANQQSS